MSRHIATMLANLISLPILLLYFISSLLPLSWLYVFFQSIVGFVLSISSNHAGDHILNRLKKAFPHYPESRIKTIMRQHLKLQAWLTAEFIKSISPRGLARNISFTISNPELLRDATAENRVIICCSGHFYNFEYLTNIAGMYDQCDFLMLYSSMGKFTLMDWVVRYARQRNGVKLIDTDSMMSVVKLALEYQKGLHGQRTLIIGVLPDLKSGSNTDSIRFFGKRRGVFTGVEKIARKIKAPCLYASPHIRNRGTVTYTFFNLEATSSDSGPYPLTHQFFEFIKADIRRCPEGWGLWGEDAVDE